MFRFLVGVAPHVLCADKKRKKENISTEKKRKILHLKKKPK